MPSNALFDQPWWLDAVAPGWEQVEVERQGEVVARLPFARRARLGRTILTQPPLTPTLGPCLGEFDGKYTRRLEWQKELMGELIEQLPPFDLFRQNFAPCVTNWLPFHWAGFTASVRYTYRIEHVADVDAVWNELTTDVRRDIRGGQKRLEVRSDIAFDEFLRLYAAPFRRQGIDPPDEELIRRIEAACGERDARTMLFAVDAQDRIHAAAYLVWDDRVVFGLMNARDEQVAERAAMSYLVWEAIQHARKVDRVFDFEGSMLEGVERFIRGFGGRQVPYFRVEKVQGLLRPVAALRDLGLWAARRPQAA